MDAAVTLPPVNFTDAEVSGLAAAVAAHRGQPFDSHARAALAKVLSVMDSASREQSSELGSRIWIDHTDTPGHAQTRRAVEQALHERVLSMGYQNARGEKTERRVDPVLLAHTQGSWHLVALSLARCDPMVQGRPHHLGTSHRRGTGASHNLPVAPLARHLQALPRPRRPDLKADRALLDDELRDPWNHE